MKFSNMRVTQDGFNNYCYFATVDVEYGFLFWKKVVYGTKIYKKYCPAYYGNAQPTWVLMDIDKEIPRHCYYRLNDLLAGAQSLRMAQKDLQLQQDKAKQQK